MLRRRAISVLAAGLLVVTALVGIVGSAGVAGASVSNSQNLPPIYSNWAQNSTNWPCYATPSYGCTQGGYSAAAAESSGWPWSEYGGGNASYNSYGPHNCTLYAAFRLAENGLGDPGALGNAAQWASNAAAKGFAVNQTPAVGSIAQWNAGGGGDGHVAYVESVDPGGTGITITEDNYVPTSATYFPGGYTAEVHITAGSSVWPANFIHFKDGGGGSPPNGSYVSYLGNVYAIAGGAPLYVSNLGTVGNPDVSAISQSQWNALSLVPANGTELDADSAVYVVAGGAPLAVASCTDDGFQYCNNLVNVDPYAIATLNHLNAVPTNGTELDADNAVYVVAGGAPLAVSSCTDDGFQYCNGLVDVSPYAISVLDHLNAVPTNGTELDADNAVYVVAGGAPLAVSSCAADGFLFCNALVDVSPYAISKLNHLQAVPADGTVLEGLPSLDWWVVKFGGLLSTTSSSFGVQAFDSALSKIPLDSSPVITSATSTTLSSGVAGSFVVTTTSFPKATIAVFGSLPAGMNFSAGVLSGTPTTSGVYPLTFAASNGIGSDAVQAFTLNIAALSVSTNSLPAGTVYSKSNKATYSATLTASGGNPPYRWSLASGSAPLPPGLKLSTAGVISGKATTTGSYSFSVQVVDTKTKKTKTTPPTQNTATAELTITIS
jgi:surface antigen